MIVMGQTCFTRDYLFVWHSAIYFSNVLDLRRKYKDSFLKKHGVKLSFMSPFVRAAAFAIADQPVINAGKELAEIYCPTGSDRMIINELYTMEKFSACVIQSSHRVWSPASSQNLSESSLASPNDGRRRALAKPGTTADKFVALPPSRSP